MFIRKSLVAVALVCSSLAGRMPSRDRIGAATGSSGSSDDVKEIFNDVADDMERGQDDSSLFYKHCLGDVRGTRVADGIANRSQPEMAKKDILYVYNRCIAGKWSIIEETEEVCRRVKLRLWGLFSSGADLRSGTKLCAALFSDVVPVEDEPYCLTFMKDISMAYAKYNKDKSGPAQWPKLVSDPRYRPSFMDSCAIAKGVRGIARRTVCRSAYEATRALATRHFSDWSKFYKSFCSAAGLSPSGSLLQVGEEAQDFHEIDYFQASLEERRHRTVGARNIMEETLHRKGGGGSPQKSSKADQARAKGFSKTQMRLCCKQAAESYEVGVDVAGFFVVGANVGVVARGFDGWTGSTDCREPPCDCKYNTGKMQTVCTGAGFSVGIDATYAEGSFHNFSMMEGNSWGSGAQVCIGICFGGGVMEARDPKDTGRRRNHHKIGSYLDTGFGFGVDLGTSFCHTWPVGGTTVTTTILVGLRDLCPDPNTCFPADAKVLTPEGHKAMADLQVGDAVLATDASGETFFDKVYFFGHADAHARTMLTGLELQSEEQKWILHLSGEHFIPTCPTHSQRCLWSEHIQSYANSVLVGDFIWSSVHWSETVQQFRVSSTEFVLKAGLYNPYTMSGNIIVDGVVASSHSSWILDPWVPEQFTQYLPKVYQVLFWPGRVMFRVAGARAAEVLDMSNPQQSPETFGHGPMFLGACGLLMMVMSCGVAKNLHQQITSKM